MGLRWAMGGAPGGIWTRDLRLFGRGYQAVAMARLCFPASGEEPGREVPGQQEYSVTPTLTFISI